MYIDSRLQIDRPQGDFSLDFQLTNDSYYSWAHC